MASILPRMCCGSASSL